jgi:hypothetical protein
MQSASDDEE